MKYRWVKQTDEDIFKVIGKKPKKITRGYLETDSEDVTESGIEIEFDEKLTANELGELDKKFIGLNRKAWLEK